MDNPHKQSLRNHSHCNRCECRDEAIGGQRSSRRIHFGHTKRKKRHDKHVGRIGEGYGRRMPRRSVAELEHVLAEDIAEDQEHLKEEIANASSHHGTVEELESDLVIDFKRDLNHLQEQSKKLFGRNIVFIKQ